MAIWLFSTMDLTKQNLHYGTSQALLLLSLSSGPDHHDVAATFINVAMMYQDIGNMNTALHYLQEALKKSGRLLGEEHIQTAVCYHALAIAFNCMGAFKLSQQVCASVKFNLYHWDTINYNSLIIAFGMSAWEENLLYTCQTTWWGGFKDMWLPKLDENI